MSTPSSSSTAVAVYCASSLGKHEAYQHAAISVGQALAKANRPLVYGGGSKGIMGVVSGAVLQLNGEVTGIVPYAMVAAGGEGQKTNNSVTSHSACVVLNEVGREKIETIVVDSMHERKVEMAKRASGFIGLPGGFGTFEEVLEVTTWTQIGIHKKPVVLLNVLSFWEPLRQLIRNGVREGFIQPQNEGLIVFVDGPSDHAVHETYNWGEAAIEALDSWQHDKGHGLSFDWTKRINGEVGREAVDAV